MASEIKPAGLNRSPFMFKVDEIWCLELGAVAQETIFDL
jgi:hypothetical protein